MKNPIESLKAGVRMVVSWPRAYAHGSNASQVGFESDACNDWIVVCDGLLGDGRSADLLHDR